jgi:NTE family protein
MDSPRNVVLNAASLSTARVLLAGMMLFLLASMTGCAHYQVNEPLTQIDPDKGYRAKNAGQPGQSQELVLYLTFSGGGTRAAAFSYGVLEELRETRATFGGKQRRLLDEVDVISAVSGGSFTAGYYGLFGDRIFEDFESRFLKKNVQGALTSRILMNPFNWARLWSPYFDRSDLAGDYYNEHVFEGKTFGDMAAAKGPMIYINATEMTTGIRLAFTQDSFDVICSDLSTFPVARAAAASSAVPILLTPITLKSYAGSCGFTLPPALEQVLSTQETSARQYHLVNDVRPFMESERFRFIHLIDGGVADNLGVRTALDRIMFFGNAWKMMQLTGTEKTHKVAFVVVNAETEVSKDMNIFGKPPAFGAMLSSYSTVAITRYNYETLMLLRENFRRWTEEVQKGRCGESQISTEPGACGDIQFYLIEVKFDALKDPAERSYFKQLPTSFKLSDDEVDKLREAARRILKASPEYQRLLKDIQ